MSTVSKRIISLLLVLFVILASFAVMPPVSSSAASSGQIKYSVSYSGKYVYLTLTPKKSTNKIYYTIDGSEVTKKANRYKKTLGLSKKTLVKAVEVNKKNKKVAVLNILVRPRTQVPKFKLCKSGKQLYLKILPATKGSKMYYTTNGKTPDTSSKRYKGPIKVKDGMTVKVRAYKKNMLGSKVVRYTVKASNINSSSPSQEVTVPVTEEPDTVDVSFTIDTDTGVITLVDDDSSSQEAAPEVTEPAASSESDIDGVFRIMNEERSSRGIAKLTLDPGLCLVADVRAKELVKNFDHYRPDGTQCFTAFDEYGIVYMAAGENIAMGQTDAEDVMDSWMHSPGHRGNILSSSFGKVGVGCYMSGGVKYWVQVFTD